MYKSNAKNLKNTWNDKTNNRTFYDFTGGNTSTADGG